MGVLSKFSNDDTLVDKAKLDEAKREKIADAQRLKLMLPAGQLAGQCSICIKTISNRAVLDPCGHAFDLEYLNEWFKTKDECPTCLAVNKKILFNIISESEYETRLTEIPLELQFKNVRFLCSAHLSRSARMCIKRGKPGFYLVAVRNNRIQLMEDSPKKLITIVDIEPGSPLFLETLDHSNQYVIDCGTQSVIELSTCHKIMEQVKQVIIQPKGEQVINSLTAKFKRRDSLVKSDK